MAILLTLTRAYNEIDGIPAAVNPMLYETLDDWHFDGLVIADDLCTCSILVSICKLINWPGIRNLITQHHVATSQSDAMKQWFNAGGMINFYDWDLDSYINVRIILYAAFGFVL